MHFKYEFLNKRNSEDLEDRNNNIKKNIVFLDIDGVLQPYGNKDRFNHDFNKTIDYLCEKYKDEIYKKIDPYDVCAVFYDWDDSAIGFLRKLLYETDSYIVFSTGWKDFNSFENLKALFRIYDLDERSIASCIKGDKINAINKYLEDNKELINSYIIIDDKDFTKEFGEKYIKTVDFFNYENYKIAKTTLENRKIVKKEDTYFIDFNKNYGYKIEAKIILNDFANKEKNEKCEISCNIIFNKFKREIPEEYYLYMAKYIKKDLLRTDSNINEIIIEIENEKIVNFFNKNGIHTIGNKIYLEQKPFKFSF